MFPEDELLLSCARTKMDSENKDKLLILIKKNLDWEYLLNLASKHKLIQLLYFHLNSICPERIPEDILNRLKGIFQENVHKNLLLTGELIKILEKLKSNGICTIHYKGPSLALLAYDNLSLRQFGDIDIIVNSTNTRKVNDLMISMEYELESFPDDFSESLYFNTQTEHKFINKNSKAVVEIHNKLQGHFFYFPVNPEFLYEDDGLITLEINNYPIKTFSIDNLLLLLCIHCARHNWSRISWICDISELIQSHEINWSQIIEKAEKLCVKRILLINLYLANQLLGLKLSNEILGNLDVDPMAINISNQITEKIFQEEDNPFNILVKILLDLKKRESLKISIIDVIRAMTIPTYLDFEELYLPSSMYYLYYLLRPILLLKRYGKIH